MNKVNPNSKLQKTLQRRDIATIFAIWLIANEITTDSLESYNYALDYWHDKTIARSVQLAYNRLQKKIEKVCG